MNDMHTFNNSEFGVLRIIEVSGETWFVGKDVALALGYSNTRDALATHVDEDDQRLLEKSETATFDIPNRGLTIINESGLYSLVLSSRLLGAKRFKHWVTHDVLPAIRKHGAYMTPETLEAALCNPDDHPACYRP